MDTSTTAEPVATPWPVALFGLDDLGKAHASRFTAAEAELATRAAALMGLHVIALDSPRCGDLAERLPAGRIFEKSGKAFVPFVARPLFERLANLSGIPVIPVPPVGPKPGKTPKPAKTPKAAPADTDAGDATLAASNLTPPTGVAPSGVPTDWPIIREGSLVLATSGGLADGWFESVVVEAKPDDLMVLRWRDFDEALFLRRRNQLALLPAGTPLMPKP